MASASASRASASRPTARPRAARPARGGPAVGVRWDRLARIALLVVLGVLVYLYARAGFTYLTTWREARHRSAQLASMERENLQLRARRASLGQASTIQAEARRLGMVLPGERAYVMQNLPSN